MSKSAKTPCECSKFSILVNLRQTEDGNLTWDAELTTGCGGRETKRTFAPGHDAKLKGFLIRAGLAGHEVRCGDISGDAITMAERFGFGQMVRSGIAGGLIKAEIKKLRKGQRSELADAAQARVDALVHDGNQARRSRELAALVEAEEAKFAAEQAASRPEPEWDEETEPEVVKAKVGRWTYDGTVDTTGEAWTFTYTDAKGATKTVTKFTLV